MADNEKRFHGYVGVMLTDGQDKSTPRCKGFLISTDRDQVQRWLSGEDGPSTTKEDRSQAKDEDVSEEIRLLRRSIQRALDTSFSIRELIPLTTSMSTTLSGVIADSIFLQPLRKNTELLEEGKQYEVRGLTKKTFSRFILTSKKLSRIDHGLENLPAAVFMSAVSTFDSVIADIVRDLMRLRPSQYFSKDRTVSLAEIAAAESFGELQERMIDDEIYQFLRGGHDDQVKTLESKFKIAIRDHWDKWSAFIEVFERRNLVAHGETVYTSRYVQKCRDAGCKDADERHGKPVVLDGDYLEQSLDIMLEFSLLLLLMLWRKNFKTEEPKVFVEIANRCYDLILTSHYSVANRVQEHALGLNNTAMSDDTRRMMTVNLASGYKHQKEDQRAAELLETMDWSATAIRYEISVAALRDDVQEVLRLFDRAVDSGELDAEKFREWPLFDFVRDTDEFQEKFRERFGEPVAEGVQRRKAIEAETENGMGEEIEDDEEGKSTEGLHATGEAPEEETEGPQGA